MRNAIIIVAGVILLGTIGYLIYDYRPTPPSSGESVEIVKPAPAVKKAPRKKVTVKAPVDVYGGDSKAKLKLPDLAPTEEVLTAAQVQPSLRPQTVTTTIDTDTGQTKTFVKADPYPWLAIETRGEARIAYGYKYSEGTTRTVARLQAGYDVLRIKALTVGVTGTIDSDRDAFIGLGVSYRW